MPAPEYDMRKIQRWDKDASRWVDVVLAEVSVGDILRIDDCRGEYVVQSNPVANLKQIGHSVEVKWLPPSEEPEETEHAC